MAEGSDAKQDYSTSVLKLPSEVEDKNYICMPEFDKVIEDDNLWDRCGKWMLRNPTTDFEWMDKTWTDLQKLLTDGSLILLKASTAARKVDEWLYGVIFCYTMPGKKAAVKAAVAIRKTVDYEYLMFFKGNKATQLGKAFRFHHKHVSKYLHSYKGRFYIRDAHFMWKLYENENDDNENDDDNENRDPACKGFPESKIFLPENWNSDIKLDRTKAVGAWNARCRSVEDVQSVYAIAKKFADEGFLTGIDFNEEYGETRVICYVSDFSDIKSHIQFCNHVLDYTQYNRFLYFDIPANNPKYKQKRNTTKYIYTSEKELYEELLIGVSKFVPL